MTNELIEEMLRTCLREVESVSTATFIESLERFYKSKGYLSAAQQESLKKIHDNL